METIFVIRIEPSNIYIYNRSLSLDGETNVTLIQTRTVNISYTAYSVRISQRLSASPTNYCAASNIEMVYIQDLTYIYL